MKSFEGSFRNLNFSPSTSILLNSFFPFTDIRCFLSSIKLQYSRTIVLLKKLKPLKKPLFQERRWSCDFPPRKTQVAQKHRAISRQEKMAFSTPVGLSWDFPRPLAESVRTDGHVTITSQPKSLRSIGYQICLAMELRWRALPAGSANKALDNGKVPHNRHRLSSDLKVIFRIFCISLFLDCIEIFFQNAENKIEVSYSTVAVYNNYC